MSGWLLALVVIGIFAGALWLESWLAKRTARLRADRRS